MGIAVALARRFARRGEPIEDLTQVALLGFVKAAARFDPTRGVGFATYATRTVLGELKRHFRDTGWAVRVPRRMQELWLAVSDAVGTLTQSLGRAPTPAEVAAAVGADEDQVLEAMVAGQAYWSSSLDAPDPTGEPLIERLAHDEEPLEHSDRRMALAGAFTRLPERERRILHLRFVDDLTQSEIAGHVGVSQMQVSRLLNRSLATLREALRAEMDGDAAPDDHDAGEETVDAG